MIIDLSCARVPRDKLENEASVNTYFKQVEEVKRNLHIPRADKAISTSISLINDLDKAVHDISFRISFRVESTSQFELYYSESYSIPSKAQRRELLFDSSGFRVVSIAISDVKYTDDDHQIHRESSGNTPILIHTKNLQNPYFGCRNEKELKVRMTLESYQNNGLPARLLLLKTLFKELKDVNETHSLDVEPPVTFDDYSLDYYRGIVQVDIISKIMMFIEDLLILSLGMLENDGYFYEWLDEKKPDIGERIKDFRKNKVTFKDDHWLRILSYANPDELKIDELTKSLLSKLMAYNISQFKRLLDHLEQFADSHIDVSRRYKHAGFPIRLGYRYDGFYPSTVVGVDYASGSVKMGKKFDSYTMVYSGSDPLAEILPIPYSRDVLDSYNVLVPDLQDVIIHIIRNKLECIKRQVKGIIPEAPSSTKVFTTKEISLLKDLRDEFNKANINNAQADLNLPLQFQPFLNKMTWYTHLDENMAKWKKAI